MRRPRVLLADPFGILLEALRRLLEPEFEVAGVVQDGPSLLSCALELKPDVILLETSLPLVNGLEAARQVSSITPHAKLVFLSTDEDSGTITEAFRMGASAYVLKECGAEPLRAAMRRALAGPGGEKWLVRASSAQRWSEAPGIRGKPSPGLTTRQRQVVQLVAQGRSPKEVAGSLGISLKTVWFHKYQAMERLGVRTTADLVRYAMRWGLIDG